MMLPDSLLLLTAMHGCIIKLPASLFNVFVDTAVQNIYYNT